MLRKRGAKAFKLLGSLKQNKTAALMKKFLLFGLMISFLLSSCKKDKNDQTKPDENNSGRSLGYTPDDDLSKIPVGTNFSFGNTNLPDKADLTDKFPPIGDQGAYGTCVAWAVAYNLKTALEGMEKNLDRNALSSPSNQLSPVDLFTAIPDNQKGENCNGTNFGFAFDVLQKRGVATLQTAPYSQIGNCTQASLQQSWTSNASGHKIKSYRKIDASVNSIKQYIAKNIPIVFGAKLADNFMTWNSDNVLSSHTTFTQVGQHAYHAMVISGYDDGKGANGAFKVINSWGTSWGSSGYIWIDYNFFINTFCTDGSSGAPLFIADNGNSDGNDDTPPDNNPGATGVDLAAWVAGDISTNNGTERYMGINIYNIGTQTAPASANWSLYYIYYNAYNADDYGIITYDEFTNTIPKNTFRNVSANHALLNYDIPPQGNLAQIVMGAPYLERTYFMPQISGYYYLVMIADLENKFQEANGMNNIFYTTTYPILFNYGFGSKNGRSASPQPEQFTFKNNMQASAELLKWNKFNTAVTEEMPNAYRPDEIIRLVEHKKKTGDLDRKINEYILSSQDKGGFKVSK